MMLNRSCLAAPSRACSWPVHVGGPKASRSAYQRQRQQCTAAANPYGTTRSAGRRVALRAHAASGTAAGQSADPAFGRAVVLGSGMAGQAAAQALSEQFAEVLVLEADSVVPSRTMTVAETVESPRNPRPGVSQYRSLHGLLARGRLEMEQLLPGFTDALVAAGAHTADWFEQASISTPAGWWARVTHPSKPIQIVLASRHLLESVTRSLVSSNPRVSMRYGCKASGLAFTDDGGSGRRVVGVKLPDGETVAADLVVVATGRKSGVTGWLQQAGLAVPPVSRVQGETGYVTCFFRLPQAVASSLPYGKFMYGLHGAPRVPNGCYIQHIDGDVWVAAAQGYCGHWPKATWEDVMRYAKQSVYNSALGELLPHAEPIGNPQAYYRAGNIWSHFEQVLPPDGLLVIGDAWCALNPVYGQGMTVAAVEVNILRGVLAAASASGGGLSGLAASFYPAATSVVKDSWLLAAGRDSDCPWTTMHEEKKSWITQLLLRYVDNAFDAAAVDAEVSDVMSHVLNMLESPEVLFRPSIFAKVFAHALLGWPWANTPAAAAEAAAAQPVIHSRRVYGKAAAATAAPVVMSSATARQPTTPAMGQWHSNEARVGAL